ncbi:MAG TPA: hypothetical protein VHC46_01425 [Thermodesulfobacteriota bacterium]|nr:hypothetical protein [Thermodesulfobacteriota bacterium]
MNFIRNITIFIVLFFASLPCFLNYSYGQETGDVKSEIKELKQMMEKMQERITELEEKNKALEEQVKEKEAPKENAVVKEETETAPVVTEAPPPQEGFLSKVAQTLNPDISVIGIFAAAWYSRDDPFVFAEDDPQQTGVNLQELELAFQSVVDPYFRFDTFISFKQDSVEVEEAYGTSLFSLPLNTQFRMGRMRAKFGRINQIHTHAQNFVTLPLVAADFLGEHLNPTSIEADFLIPVPWYMELSALGGSPDVETPTFAEDESNASNLGYLLYVFHLANFFEVSDSLGVNLGASFATGPNGTGAKERSNLYGADFYAKYRPLRDSGYTEFRLQSEFMWRQADTPDEKLEDYGFYGEGIYRFAKRWNTGLRFDFTDTNTPVPFSENSAEPVTADAADLVSGRAINPGETLGLPGRAYRISPMLTFAPSEFSQFRLEYDYLNQNYAGNQHAIFLQFQYAIGAHGAHPY